MGCGSGCCGSSQDAPSAPGPLDSSQTSQTLEVAAATAGDNVESKTQIQDKGTSNTATTFPQRGSDQGSQPPTVYDNESFGAYGGVSSHLEPTFGVSPNVSHETGLDESVTSRANAERVEEQRDSNCCDQSANLRVGAPLVEEHHNKSCCGVPKDDQLSYQDRCYSAAAKIKTCTEIDVSPSEGCGDGCCDVPKNDQVSCRDKCCPTDPIGSKGCTGNDDTVSEGCGDGCCLGAAPELTKEQPEADCCAGKTSPCCSFSCIDRLALRECQSQAATQSCCGDKSGEPENNCPGARDGKACRDHTDEAYGRYRSQLEAIGCICRALLALGQESCCIPSRPSSSRSRRGPRPKNTSKPRGTLAKTGLPIRSDAKGSCGDGVSETQAISSCADACCEKPQVLGDKQPSISARQVKDLERGNAAGREHVVLSISGMTCTGCETKLQRTLATVSAVTNLKTSLVLARAEFDLDGTASSPADIIKHLERTTEFKCERVTSRGSSIDLVCPNMAYQLADEAWPHGVLDLTAIDGSAIRVDFDPKIIGARDLATRGWGTPLQLAPPQPDRTLDTGARHVRSMGWLTLFSTALTIPVLVMAWAPLPDNEIAYGSASLALATIVQVFVAGPFYPKAIKAIVFSRVIEMDLLIVLSTSAAYVFSVISFGYLAAGRPLSTGEFFETSTLLVTLIMVGRYVAALARQKALESISIRSLQVSSAALCLDDGTEQQIDVRLLQFGDVFKVAPDSVVPTDGTVISGQSEVDESMLTGESAPVEKQVGSIVVAGSVNGSGLLTVRLTRLPNDNTISTIAGMVDEAKLSKPKIQETANLVASYFVPVVAALTALTFVIWLAVGISVQGKSGRDAAVQAVTYGITVLIVSCPCAVGLAVPMVIVVATGVAAEHGVIFKSSESIESAYRTSHVVFDKTGTLTQGKLEVVQAHYHQQDSQPIKAMLLALVDSVKHPVSTAIASHLKGAGIAPDPDVTEIKTRPGQGVEARHNGHLIRAGNSRWLEMADNDHVRAIQMQGQTAFCLVSDGMLLAIFGLSDSLRHGVASVISRLHDSGIIVHLLSGDDDGAVRAVAAEVGIPCAYVHSRCSPADKQAYIKGLLGEPASASKSPTVIFCGDGTNDAAALAQATIGIHVNEGTDVAQSAADVVLMRPNLDGVLTAIAISKRSIHRIAFNFGWSFVYNLFAILLSAGAFVYIRIPPAYAGLGELVSVLPVIAAAVSLRAMKGH